MEEKEILLKTIEGLNASIASLSTTNKNQSEQIKNLQERIRELTAQVAWLNRQLFGRKSEKLRVYDPNMPDLFADEFSGLRQQAEEKRDEAVEKIEKESVEDVKRNRQNRKMIEDLPVLETDTIEPKGVDLSLYRRIGEEITKVVKHKPGMLCRKLFRGRLSVAGGLSKCIRRKYEDRADGELWHRNGCLHAGNALFGY